jgi:hypothetical protein
MKIRPVGAELFHADRKKKPKAAFRDFPKGPKTQKHNLWTERKIEEC